MTGSNEFFRLNAEGKKEDAFLHDEILDNPDADRATMVLVRKRALETGMTQEEVDRVFPLD